MSVCWLYINSSYAQYLQPVQYFKNNGRQVTSLDSADYTRAVMQADSGSALYNIAEFYTDGKYRFKGKSSTLSMAGLQGAGISYFPNGNKKAQTDYKDGQPVNQRLLYYPDGKEYLIIQYNGAENLKRLKHNEKPYLVIAGYDKAGKSLITSSNGDYKGYNDDFTAVTEEGLIKNGMRDGIWKASMDSNRTHLTEVYNNGQLISGKAVYKDGTVSEYNEVREVSPEFKGGLRNLYSFLARNLRYPEKAVKKEIQGQVMLSFIVENDGTLTNMKVVSSPDKELSQEAMRVVQLKQDWTPGTRYGRKDKFVFLLPVVFRLGKD